MVSVGFDTHLWRKQVAFPECDYMRLPYNSILDEIKLDAVRVALPP